MGSPRFVVVGAGPAGSTAARLLALHGARVTLLEARRLPRDKACAGGVTPKARQWVPEDVLASARSSVHRFEFRGGWLPPFQVDEPAAAISMFQRTVFDLALAESAAAAGVDVHDGERVEQVIEHEHGVKVRTRHATLDAEYVIGADGYPSRVARDLGLGQAVARRSLALGGEVALSTTLPADLAVISFSAPRGYAWYFPKGDHASVGVGTHIASHDHRQAVAGARNALAALASRVGVDIDRLRLAGHWVPQGIAPGPLTSRHCLLVGDAAGTADPLLGEGIAYAIGSGRLGAQALLDMAAGRTADLTPYEDQLRAAYGPAMHRLDFAARIVERSPAIALAAARMSPWVRAYGVNVVAGLRAPFAFAPPEA